jgi:hypothetical protein
MWGVEMRGQWWFKRPLSCLLGVILLLSTVPACKSSESAAEALQSVYLLNRLSLELQDTIGQKVWCLGVYGDTRFSDLGIGFLVLNYDMLLVDEAMARHSYAVLDGNLPPAANNGDEILVYGEVKEFGDAYGAFAAEPTSLITVEDYHVLHEDARTENWEDTFIDILAGQALALFAPSATLLAQNAAPAGTKPSDCDRALILSGGIDDTQNQPRYKTNIMLKYAKLKELGFTNGQIDVLYNDGADIATAGDPIKTQKADLATVKSTIEKYGNEMKASCTLTIFVTDHGTGYNSDQGYEGARPALQGSDEYQGGLTYPENTFKVDARKLVYRYAIWTNADGDTWLISLDNATGRLELFKREDGDWVYKGRDTNGDGRITEAETGQDIDGNGAETNLGWNQADIGVAAHGDQEWDTDQDGTNDVRLHWDEDAGKFLFQRLVGADWKTMAEDTNGDFIIDGADGGVDWNLDGDKGDRVGFHEGINLWGTGKDSVLWDDEFASLMKGLSDKGIHIVIEMIQCFSGGFVQNCVGKVDKIVTGSGEDTKHWNYPDAAGVPQAVDEKAFIENLHGIDVESWNYAFDKAREADTAAWRANYEGQPKYRNDHTKWEKPVVPTDSVVAWNDGYYDLVLWLPEELVGKVYDMEIYYGLQRPRWTDGRVVDMPENFDWEAIPGGLRIWSNDPFSEMPLPFHLYGAGGSGAIKVQLTDKDHKPIGYVVPRLIEILPVPELVLDAGMLATVNLEWTEDVCGGTVTVDIAAIDLSGGGAPLVRVVLTANGLVWADSGLLPEGVTQVENSVTRDVLCGQPLQLVLEATNIYGQVARKTQESVIPIPARPEELPIPPTFPPSTQTVLQAAVAVSGESMSTGTGCTSTITITYDGTDLTGGDYPVTQVVLTVNGSVWDDSGSISQTQFHNVVSRSVGCGQTFNVSVSATNSLGQTATASGSFTTPVP